MASAAPGSAMALTAIESGGGVAVFGGDGADDGVTVSQVNISATDYLKIDDVAPVTASSGCSGDVNGDAFCPATGVTLLAVSTGSGNDAATVDPSVPASVNTYLLGGDGNDQLAAGAGNDFIDGGFGSDDMSGGAGTDTVTYANRAAPVKARIQPSATGPDATGRSGNLDDGEGVRDTIRADVENLTGGSENDRLYGNDLANTINGGYGDDLIGGGDGADVLNGGPGEDTTSYAGHSPGVTATIGTTGNGNVDDGTGDTIDTSTENLTGSDGADTLTGDNKANVLDGGAGADAMNGAGAPYPALDAVSYASHLEGVTATIGAAGASGNVSDGPEGARDTINNDIWKLIGSDANDTLTGNGDINVIDGGEGNDTLDGGLGPDWMIGGNGIDTVTYADRATGVVVDISRTGASSQPTNDGNELDGSTTFRDRVDLSVENLIGTAKSDTLTGNDSGNGLIGGHGADHLSGLGGIDALDGGPGRDELRGGSDSDKLTGGRGPDKLFGNGGADRLNAADGKKDKAISCDGGAPDRATIDSKDPAPTGCEKVRH
jgi:Ca2+-binding RTX toxin-like protein